MKRIWILLMAVAAVVFAEKKTNKTITLNASYIVQASNGDYIGIQYIQVSKDSVKEEFGTTPKLN